MSASITTPTPADRTTASAPRRNQTHAVWKWLEPVASLRLTVVLFALSILLVLIGTLAQVEMDIWAVMGKYFRSWFCWVPVRILLPQTWFAWSAGIPDAVGFPFIGGKTLGVALTANLLAAHLIRFRVKARRGRLAAGGVILAVGTLLTWLVIKSGHNSQGIQGRPPFSWEQLWVILQWSVMAITGALGIWGYTMDRSRRVERLVIGGVTLALAALTVLMFSFGSDSPLSGPSLRVLWQLIQAGLAALVLLAGSWLLFGKRGGVVLLHLGILLLMGYEFYVDRGAEESQMQIMENQTVNFARDVRKVELAIVDASDPEVDQVVVIPGARLREGERISDDNLPMDVEVVQYYANADLRLRRPGEQNPATAGIGLEAMIEPKKAGTGTDTDQAVDQAAAYVRFYPKGSDKPLGTYLLSQIRGFDDQAETLQTPDGKQYGAFLRYRRIYKPYQVTLLDVRKDDYIGTNTPMNYSSDIRLVDPTTGTDRKIHIWMNNPLRYAGDTFYQSNYFRMPDQRELTVLQVVTNQGWMAPYVACMIVGIGMLAHFILVLVRFLRREEAGAIQVGEALSPRDAMASWVATLIVLAVAGGMILSRSRSKEWVADGMRLDLAARLPVVHEGRPKPLDTVARISLRAISDRDYYKDAEGERQPAIRWLLDVISDSPAAYQHQVFRIQNLEVLDTLGLKRRKHYRYALDEFFDQAAGESSDPTSYRQQISRAMELRQDEAALSFYQRKLLETEGRIRRFTLLQAAFRPLPFPPLPTAEEFEQDREGALKRLEEIRSVVMQMGRFEATLNEMQPPLVVHNPEAEASAEQWKAFAVAANEAYMSRVTQEEPLEGTIAWATILDAYRRGDAKTFNSQVESYLASIEQSSPGGLETQKLAFEFAFNQSDPFMQAMVLYIGAFLLAVCGWAFWQPMQRASFWLIALAFLLHTFALGARIYISGRPPVTNLYSAAVFIGWGCVILGMILEWFYRLGLGNIVAALIGFATLMIADLLASSGDTMTVLIAVLDTQFWLATHVVCVTLGYATTYVAGFLGLLYLLVRGLRLLGRQLPQRLFKAEAELPRMIYGVLCFAIFFSFVGTVLGGLWADDSWGRFWGWDPKENGALIIVLWNALILHARWGGLVKGPGLAMLAVAGNITTSWSMWGVNELGVGLHSYGFTEGVLPALGTFVLSQLALIGAGMVIESRLRRKNSSVELA